MSRLKTCVQQMPQFLHLYIGNNKFMHFKEVIQAMKSIGRFEIESKYRKYSERPKSHPSPCLLCWSLYSCRPWVHLLQVLCARAWIAGCTWHYLLRLVGLRELF